MIDFCWQVFSENKDTYQDIMKNTCEFILTEFSLENFDVEVVVCDNEQIRQINSEFRGIDKPTDVLSFPNFQVAELEKLSNTAISQYLGSIIISLDKAIEQSIDFGHSIVREIGFLTTHGMLHILGYDHIEPKDETNMKNKAYELLSKLNINR